MKKPIDVSGKPGDIVLARVGKHDVVDVWSRLKGTGDGDAHRNGVVRNGALGIVIVPNSPERRGYAYVMWSMPCIAGWVHDGYLRKV